MAATLDAELERKIAENGEGGRVEPIGIVISRGDRGEPTPAFLSFEWSTPPATKASTPKRRRG